jgi:hypothetical protein
LEDPYRVDSFKFLPRLISTFYKMTMREPELPIPWTSLTVPIEECTFALINSAGMYHVGVDPPFDLEREKNEPTWGDPTYRRIPSDISRDEVGVSHLHLNTEDMLEDLNIVLPLDRFAELVEQGVVGGLARTAFSFMGYQGFPPDTREWEDRYGPRVAEEMKGEDCAINVPVLARTLEANGIATVLVTGMPYWAELVGVPRTLAVEFPFAHTLGLPNEVEMQTRVIDQALDVLRHAQEPGEIVHSREVWPGPQKEWMKLWQPSTPSPIIEHLAPRLREMLRDSRKRR